MLSKQPRPKGILVVLVLWACAAMMFFLCAGVLSAEESVNDILKRGLDLINKDDYIHARTEFEKALALDPKSFIAMNYLGLTYFQSEEDMDKAIYYFKKSNEFKPEYTEPLLNLAMSYSKMERWDDALAALKGVFASRPDDSRGHFYAGWIYLMGKKEPDKAVDHFLQVVSITQYQPQALYGLGVAYALSGDRPLALGVITDLRSIKQELLATKVEDVMRQYRIGSTAAPESPIRPKPVSPKPKPVTAPKPKTVKTGPPSVNMTGQGTLTINTTISAPPSSRPSSQSTATLKGKVKVPRSVTIQPRQ